jgi:hypothetical protein
MHISRRISRHSCQGFCSISSAGPQGLCVWSNSLKGGAGNTYMPLHDHPYSDVNITLWKSNRSLIYLMSAGFGSSSDSSMVSWGFSAFHLKAFSIHIIRCIFVWHTNWSPWYSWKWRKTPTIKINQSNQYDAPFVKSALNFTVLAQKLLSRIFS